MKQTTVGLPSRGGKRKGLSSKRIFNKPSVSIREFFLHYPNKKYSKSCKYTRPYLPKAERTDNELSLTIKEYQEIISYYLEEKKEMLLQGSIVSVGKKMGHLQIVKYKPKDNMRQSKLNWKVYYETGKKEYYTNEHSNGYSWAINWLKPNYRFLRYWHHRLVPSVQKQISTSIFDNPDVLLNFNES
mgnify:CR=1 FL=1